MTDFPAELDQKIVIGNTNTGGRSDATYDPEKGRSDLVKEEQEIVNTLSEPVWETIKRDLKMTDFPAELDQKIVIGNTNTGGRSDATYDPEKGRSDLVKEEQEIVNTLSEPVW
eukprot:CAMPEP_0205805252 /NCGR_PEP_ID=MMETSP0205-20121125/8420_1 /ASSEMBLY_ACC=CAM_ASM_000278 /TAXON_ID=36767 /ORGANISM="Euplotes focardii, Strain TN1" /LENGTH=112 /DNA_ID=CAMNT_0053076173 /DNA_START=25 /DNA_END=360 /DNA_ORIENTATION=+